MNKVNVSVLSVLGLIVVVAILQFTGVADVSSLLQSLLDTLTQLLSQHPAQ